MKKVLAVVLGLVFVAAACNNNPPAENTNNNQPETSAPAENDNSSGSSAGEEADVSAPVEVRMTAKGFEPANITVKKGTKVTFVNQDTKARWPASGPHPTHTNYPQFDPKASVATGASWSFTFDRVGEWKFHDHLTPTMFGSVIVTE